MKKKAKIKQPQKTDLRPCPVSFRLDEADLHRLNALASQSGRSRNDIGKAAINRYLDELETQRMERSEQS